MKIPRQNKKHIAIFIDSMHGGGAERVCLSYIKHLLSKDYTVDLILFSFSGELLNLIPDQVNLWAIDEKYEANKSIYKCSIPTPKVKWLYPNEKMKLPDFIRNVFVSWPYWPYKIPRRSYRRVVKSFAVSKYLVDRNPCLVFAMLADSYYYSIVGRQIAKTSTPIICSIRSAVIHSKKFKIKAYKKLLVHADWVHVVSSDIAPEIVKMGNYPKEKITAILNPIYFPSISVLASQPAEHPWIVEKDENKFKIVLAIGRLAEQKNFFLLLKAFALVHQNLNSRLIILGEGKERSRLQALITKMNLNKYVSMPGWVTNPYSYLARSDIFVLTSNLEGCPNVLIEALACGCPIVATDCPHGPREILDNGRYGTLVPMNNVTILVHSILESLGKEKNCDFLVKRAMEFSPEKIFPQYDTLIQKFTSEVNTAHTKSKI